MTVVYIQAMLQVSPHQLLFTFSGKKTIPLVNMNKLLVITLLVGLLSFGAQGFRMPRQAEEAEEVAPEAPEEAPEAPIAAEVAPESPEEAPEAPIADEVAPEAPEEAPEAPIAEEVAPEAPEEAPEAPIAEELAPEEPAETAPEHGPAAPEESTAEAGPLAYVTDTIRNVWDKTVDTASSWIETVKGLKLEEKAKSLYDETTSAVQTYAGILQDQVYHVIYPTQ